MPTKTKDIKAAVTLMDKTDATLWNADGSPKLDKVQALVGDDTMTAADVAAALGIEPAKAADPSAPTEAQKLTTGALDDRPDNVEPLDPTSPEYALKALAAARTANAAIQAEIDENKKARDKINERIQTLTAEADHHIIIIEHFGPRVSHAQAVKAIQQQTVRTAAQNKERMHLAATALQASGAVVVPPSKLDAALMARRRTTDQVKNQAQYIHQQAQERNASRG